MVSLEMIPGEMLSLEIFLGVDFFVDLLFFVVFFAVNAIEIYRSNVVYFYSPVYCSRLQ